MLNYENQLNLGNIYQECSEIFAEQRPEFLNLMEQYLDIDKYISYEFKRAFYADTGRPRGCSLYGYISALILQKIFNIPTDTLLILILTFSSDLRHFCGIDKVPDSSKWTRFKQDFCEYLNKMFIDLVDVTEPICEAIDPVLSKMISYGSSHEKNRADRHKWVCPKTKRIGTKLVCTCDNPCTSSKYGRVIHTFPDKNHRLYPGTLHGTDEWSKIYKIRVVVEKAINHMKSNMSVAGRKTRNALTTKADVFLAGIAQLFTVIIADSMSKPQYIRSIKKLAC